MIFIAGISIALFISSLLIVKKDKSKSDYILMVWMILNALHLALFYLTCYETIYEYPHLLGIQFPFPLIHGVLLYYYVATVTNQTPKRKGQILLHFVPSILTYLYLISFFIKSGAEKTEIFKSGGEGYEVFQLVLLIAVFISGIIYVIWSSLILKWHKKRIRNEFSNIEDINLNWLRLLIYGLGAVWMIVILTENDSLIHTGVSIFVILVGFFGIQQKNIFTTREEISIDTNSKKEDKLEQKSTPQIEEEKPKGKYLKSGLTDEKAEQFYIRLLSLMTEDKVYTNSELSLSELARMLDINPNYLSQIINEKENKSFYDFINSYRVEEFKRLISNPKNRQFTLMAIAYDCGFNSKSSFNRYFKKMTDLTPSQYVKPLKGEN